MAVASDSPALVGSTIGAGGLNFRVRDGSGCGPAAMATGTTVPTVWYLSVVGRVAGVCEHFVLVVCQVLGLLVPVGCAGYPVSTSGLSTQWSAGGLTTLDVWEISSWSGLRA